MMNSPYQHQVQVFITNSSEMFFLIAQSRKGLINWLGKYLDVSHCYRLDK